MSNTTHRKQLARRLARATGQTYAASLQTVREAAEAGHLPGPLDPDGMDRALARLVALAATTEPTAEPTTEPIALDADPGDYLVPGSLALLRKVWQGRVTKEATGRARDRSRFAVDNRPAPEGQDLDLFLLEREGYISARLNLGEEWALARTTDLGDRVLAANAADTDRFADGIPAGSTVGRDREPYVGEGVDGALRSARIDREEADGLDRDDPRHEEVLASAARWEDQARRLEQDATPAIALFSVVDRAIAAVEKEPFSAVEGGRRKASAAADQRIWDLSWVYERLSGHQGLVYVSSPGGGADRYVFGQHHIALGRQKALSHVIGLVDALRGREDLDWPLPPASQDVGEDDLSRPAPVEPRHHQRARETD